MSKTDGHRDISAVTQEQFLTVLSREEAMRRFYACLAMRPLGEETVALAESLGRVTSQTLRSPIDVPPFDRALVDGFAIRAGDVTSASEQTPICLALNLESIACGTAPRLEVAGGSATPIATGGPLPRGADAVCMVEHSDPGEADDVLIRRALAPGQNIGFAGADIARGETLLRRGCRIGSREIGMMAACGVASVAVYRRPRVAILSTGDELVQPGEPLRPAAIYDSNAPIVAAAVQENGGASILLGAIGDNEAALEAALRDALARCDGVILSGGTSKSAGDLTYRVVARLGAPGIIAHGVALKPGKPLCLAVVDGKPVVILPGFPTSAMFTFHDFVAPVIRAMSGLAARLDASVEATTPFPIHSDLGRTEFVMVALTQREDGLKAFPLGKGSGAVSGFARADGFLRIDALADHLEAGARTQVTLFDPELRVPDLVIMGSHCIGLEIVIDALAEAGIAVRVVAIGSMGGLAAARRNECDIAPIHLMDEKTGVYNAPFLGPEQRLVRGWRRMQGLVFRAGDARFEGRAVDEAISAALADPACIMINRNQGAGTRIMIDRLIGAARPNGYWNQPSSHNAVAAAVAQQRADWGVAIEPVARAYGLGFLPIGEELYDFVTPLSRCAVPAVHAFIEALGREDVQRELGGIGFTAGAPKESETPCA
ncbi:molybdopterin biosynthesis protein [Methylosinus sp. C49]|uniref:molybdopterin biosynthesis protein n=1 Tax=Methylosinus sp. C49 TaxID=2699395 RepID=UPI0013671BE9|nr:molybdopterin biosynthesis protein [Methylosinus sp. C49]BBU62129.1 molybdopterin biosynthesis protein [Methylosinus sp. C49]